MWLEVGQQSPLRVERIAAVFRLDDTAEMRASPGPKAKQGVADDQIAGRAEAKLVADGQPAIKVWLRGRKNEPQVTLLLEPYDPEQRGWLASVNPQRAVYQRHEDDAWEFLSLLFANRLAASEQCIEAIEARLPQGACLLREAGSSTARWIGELAGALTGAGVVGWYGRLRTDSVRLVSILDPPHEPVGCQWIGDYVVPSAAGARASALTLEGRVDLGGNPPLAVLEEILHDAEEPSVDHSLLRVRPGPANVRGESVLVESVVFEHAEDVTANSLRVVLAVRMPVEPSLAAVRRRWRTVATVTGWARDAWEEGATSLLEVTPDPSLETPSTVDPRGVETRALVARALTPAPVRDSAAGFYASRGEPHEMVLDLATGEMPWVVGAVQTYDEHLEGAQLALQSERVAVTSSPRGSALEEATGLRLTGAGEAALRTSKDGRIDLATGSVSLEAEKQATVKSTSVTLKGDTVIDGKAALTGEVEMGSA